MISKILDIPYNTQVDNTVSYFGESHIQLDAGSQCGLVMAAHVNFPITGDISDEWVQAYAERLDMPGSDLHEAVKKEIPWFWLDKNGKARQNVRLSSAINSHAIATRIIGQTVNSNLKVKLCQVASIDEVIQAIDNGSPVGIFTKLTPSGHFITIIGYENDDNGTVTFICHDGYGNFYPGWNPESLGKGGYVKYPAAWLITKTGGNNLSWLYYWII